MDRKRIGEIRQRPIRELAWEPLPAPEGAPRRTAVPLKDSGTRPRLFMVPGQVGQLFHFKRLTERIRDDIRVIGLEAPGLRGDRKPIDDIEELAAHNVREVRAIQPRGPHLIGGFSVGVAVAYAMAAQLEADGDPPHLVLFDWGPNRNKPRTGLAAKVFRLYFWARYHWDNWHGLEGQRRAAYRRDFLTQRLRVTARMLRLKPDGWLYRKWMERQNRGRFELPAAHADVRDALRRAGSNWEWSRCTFRQPFTLFRAKIQGLGQAPDQFLGFDRETAPGGVEVRHIPGLHHFMFVEPHVFTLIAELEDWIDRVTDGDTTTAPKSTRDTTSLIRGKQSAAVQPR